MENNITEKDEISIIDLLAVLFRYKWMIIIITAIAAIGILIFSILSLKLPPEKSPLPNKYRSEALMLINDSNSSGGGLSLALASSGLGGMASLMGVSVPAGGQSYSRLAEFLSKTNSFLDAVVDEFNLKERYHISSYPKTDSRKALSSCLSVSVDDKTGVFKISFEDIDAEFAREVVLFCVNYYENKFLELGLDKDIIEKKNIQEALEECMKKIESVSDQIHKLESSTAYSYGGAVSNIIFKTQKLKMELNAQKKIYAELKLKFEMLDIKMKSTVPVLQILELPEVSDKKSAPSRGKLCIIVTIAAFFVSIFIAFLLNAIKNIKNDKSAMSKLKGVDKNEME